MCQIGQSLYRAIESSFQKIPLQLAGAIELEMCLHARAHFLQLEGLRDVVHATGSKSIDLVARSLSALKNSTGIGASFSSAFSRWHTSKPSISGMLMSSRTRSGRFRELHPAPGVREETIVLCGLAASAVLPAISGWQADRPPP